MKNKKTFLIIFLSLFFFSKNVYANELGVYKIEGDRIKSINNGKIIVAEGGAKATNAFGLKILSDKITYDKQNSKIISEKNSIFIDKLGNSLSAETFVYNLNTKIILADMSVKFKDIQGNTFYFSNLEYNEETGIGVGKKFTGKLIDKSTIQSNEAEFNNNLKTLILGKNADNFFDKILSPFSNKNNTYTPCQKSYSTLKSIKDSCPDWSIETDSTFYDRENKMLYHYGSIVKIKNFPIFYTPYFSHPDPSVDRKSGILPPTIKNFTDLGQTIKAPYFWVIDKNKDMLITPIYYFDEKNLYLAEYRQQNLNSRFYIDGSFTKGYKNLNKNDDAGNLINRSKGSRNHIFFNFLGNHDDLIFNKNDIEINLQRISQKNYLKINEINTNNLSEDKFLLNNNFIINSYENNKKLTVRSDIYENLNIDNNNTKYQYIIPKIDFSNFFKKYNNYINLSNSFAASNLGGDSNQVTFRNKIDANSNPIYFKNFFEGLSGIFKNSLNNINDYNKNIINKKDNFNSKVFLTTALESTFPLIKLENKKEETIIPKVFTKFTSGSMGNASNEDKKLSYGDIYSMNRTNNLQNPETGGSVGYGIEYNMSNKNSKNEIYNKISSSVGQIINYKKNGKMPYNSTLQNKRSAFVGDLSALYDTTIKNKDSLQNNYTNNKIEMKYSYAVSQNMKEILQNSFDASYYNKLNSYTLNYYELNEIGQDHYINFKYNRKFNEEINFSTGIKKNLQYKFTESNYIQANYDTDCINIGIELNKKFYKNDEIKPSNNLTLSITLKPFGKPISPDLSSFVK